MENFNVIYRNFGHWDICNSKGRIFAIRGGPSKYYVRDERNYEHNKKECVYFKTVSACMTYICDILMYELIVVNGQNPTIIYSWNI